MEENFNSAFTLPSNSKEDPQMNVSFLLIESFDITEFLRIN